MIVKITSYIKARNPAIAKNIARAFVRYIIHRPDREGERDYRTLIGADGPMEKYLGYNMINGSPKNTVFIRLAISPAPKTEDINKDLDLWLLTQNAMAFLKEHLGKDIQFLAAAHENQTDIRHVNALVFVPGRLSKK